MHARRLRTLVESGMGLYASHLPLDAHKQLGNNAQLAKALGLRQCRPFGVYHGETIGIRGVAPKPWTRARVAERLVACLGAVPKVLPLGPERITSLAIVSGGGGDMVSEAFGITPKVDAFITGEASHWIYPLCQEASLNVYLGGHYATETFGVKALGSFLEKKCGIRSVFLDLPTGM
jgi:putative NIF3 family GTP cyclohydrolase 1 type 2